MTDQPETVDVLYLDDCRVDEETEEIVARVRLAMTGIGGDVEVRMPLAEALDHDPADLRRVLCGEALAEAGVGLHGPHSKIGRGRKLVQAIRGAVVVDDGLLAHARDRAPARREARLAREEEARLREEHQRRLDAEAQSATEQPAS